MSVKNDIYAIRDSLLDWLKEHRHGVMGTVIFHLVLAIFLACVGISRLDSQQRMEIEIDMPEPEIVQQKQEEQKKKEQILQQSADEVSTRMTVGSAMSPAMTGLRKVACWAPAPMQVRSEAKSNRCFICMKF